MAVTQYVGPKIVPHGFTDWNATTAYDGLYCAYYGYQWYIACNGPVPVGVSPVDREYWAPYSLNSGDIQNITAKVNSLFPEVPISDGTDLNTITTPGNYLGSSNNNYLHKPTYYTIQDPSFTLTVKKSSSRVQQVLIANASPNEEFIRVVYESGEASNWIRSDASNYYPVEHIDPNTGISDLNSLIYPGSYMLNFNANSTYTHIPNDLVWNKIVGSIDGKANLQVIPSYESATNPGVIQIITSGRANPYQWIRSRDYGGSWGVWVRSTNQFNTNNNFNVDDANDFFEKDLVVGCSSGIHCPNIGVNTSWKLSWNGNLQIATSAQYNLIYTRRYWNNNFYEWTCVNKNGITNDVGQKYSSQFIVPANKKYIFTTNNRAFIYCPFGGNNNQQAVGVLISESFLSLNSNYNLSNVGFQGNTTNGAEYFVNNPNNYQVVVNLFGGEATMIRVVDAQ